MLFAAMLLDRAFFGMVLPFMMLFAVMPVFVRLYVVPFAVMLFAAMLLDRAFFGMMPIGMVRPFMMFVAMMLFSMMSATPGPVFVIVRCAMVLGVFPKAALAVAEHGNAWRTRQFQHMRVVRQRGDGPCQKGLEVRSDPDHEVGALQQGGIGRLERIGMGRGAAENEHVRLGDARHHAGQQGVERLDAGDGDRSFVAGRRARQQRHAEGNGATAHQACAQPSAGGLTGDPKAAESRGRRRGHGKRGDFPNGNIQHHIGHACTGFCGGPLFHDRGSR